MGISGPGEPKGENFEAPALILICFVQLRNQMNSREAVRFGMLGFLIRNFERPEDRLVLLWEGAPVGQCFLDLFVAGSTSRDEPRGRWEFQVIMYLALALACLPACLACLGWVCVCVSGRAGLAEEAPF
jgi:hypothetical protein